LQPSKFKMKIILATLLLLVFAVDSLLGCGCEPRMNDLKTDIDSSHVIFIGVVTKISKEHKFHLNDGFGKGLKYINFDILKTYKGINHAQLKLTLFDTASNSSCEGIVYGKALGDTVLVFANEFASKFPGSYLCGRHPTFQQLLKEETNFIDTALWIDPKSLWSNANEYIKNTSRDPSKKMPLTTSQKTYRYLGIGFLASILLNFLLGFLLLKNIKSN